MTDKHNSQIEKNAALGLTPGMLLRQSREAAGLTHAAVGEALHLTVHYVKSLENDDYAKLPGLIFVKGYLRAYARYLKLDVDELLARYDRHLGTLPEIKNMTLGGNYTRKRNDLAYLWAVAAAIVVFMGLGTGWWFFGRDSVEPAPNNTITSAAQIANATRSAAVQSVAPPPSTAVIVQPALVESASGDATNVGLVAGVVLASTSLLTADVVSEAASILPSSDGQQTVIVAVAEPAASDVVSLQGAGEAATTTVSSTSGEAVPVIVPSVSGGRQISLLGEGPDQLQLVLSGDSWVEIDDVRNVRLYNEMLSNGDSLLIKGYAPFQLLLGDGHNVAVTLNSVAIDISSSIRGDNTSRIVLSNPATLTVPLAEPAVPTVQTNPAVVAPATTNAGVQP